MFNRIHPLALALALSSGLLLAACGGTDVADSSAGVADTTAGTNTEATPARPSNTQPMPTAPVDLSAFDKLTDSQLRSGHALAVEEGRFLEPATNNAVTYQLAMRHRFGREGTQQQLIEFTTDLLIRAELAIKKGDAAERTRFIQLLDAIDPTHPSLPRLKAMHLGQDAWGEPVAQAPTTPEALSQGLTEDPAEVIQP